MIVEKYLAKADTRNTRVRQREIINLLSGGDMIAVTTTLFSVNIAVGYRNGPQLIITDTVFHNLLRKDVIIRRGKLINENSKIEFYILNPSLK